MICTQNFPLQQSQNTSKKVNSNYAAINDFELDGMVADYANKCKKVDEEDMKLTLLCYLFVLYQAELVLTLKP